MGEVRVGLGSCCVAGGSAKIREALEEELADLKCHVDIKPVGCVGMCHRTPLVEVVIPGEKPALYAKVDPEDIPEIVERHFTSSSPFIRIRAATENLLKKLYTDAARHVAESLLHSLGCRPKQSPDTFRCTSRVRGCLRHALTKLGCVQLEGCLDCKQVSHFKFQSLAAWQDEPSS